jgi:hypothetical protein
MSTTTEVDDVYATSWKLTSSVAIDASAEHVYNMVSDITRMGEWSPECFGGKWISGTPGAEGARFHGFNREGAAVWTSESEVIEAKRSHSFAFTVLSFCAGEPDESSSWLGGSQPGDMTWAFHVEENGDGCVLTQVHTMRMVGPFYRAMLEEVDESKRLAHVQTRKEHLHDSMKTTLANIKAAAERQN